MSVIFAAKPDIKLCDAVDTPNGYRTPQGTRYYDMGHQGNIRQVTDSVGTLHEKYMGLPAYLYCADTIVILKIKSYL